MLKVKLNTTSGKEAISFSFATSLEELPLSNYCEWLPIFREYIDFLDSVEGKNLLEINNRYKYINLLSRMVAEWSGQSLQDIMNLPQGNFVAHFKSLLDEGEELDLDSLEDSLFKLASVALNAVSSYKSKPSPSFEYQGETFYLSEAHRDALKRDINDVQLTTQEVVETLDMQRKVANANAKESDKLFHNFLEQMAILSHRRGFSLPTDDVRARTYINSQREHFAGDEGEGIPSVMTADALNIDFFFGGRLGLLKTALQAVIFLIPLKDQQAA